MADQQAEDGYSKIANDLLGVIIRFPFTQRQYKAIIYIIRHTYGCKQNDVELDYTIMADRCGIAKNHFSASVAALARMNVVLIKGSKPRKVALQEDYSRWRPLP